MNKRVFSLLLVFMLVALMVGCSNEGETPESTTEPQPTLEVSSSEPESSAIESQID